MRLARPTSKIYVPDGAAVEEAVAAATHAAIGAHPDDIEILAYHGILECFHQADKHFVGVTVTNGGGSPRDGLYAHYTDEEMQEVRRAEQKKAAHIGEYCAQAFLDYPSDAVKDPTNLSVIEDIKQILDLARPGVVYTHNLADKHDTHVAVALRTIRAIRELAPEARPGKLLGCEVWRDLDWLNDEDKVVLNVEAHENLAAALVGVYDSQICGGKRYDLATFGRRRANATYFASHGVDVSSALTFALDLTPLVRDDSLDPSEYMRTFVDRFAEDVSARLLKLS